MTFPKIIQCFQFFSFLFDISQSTLVFQFVSFAFFYFLVFLVVSCFQISLIFASFFDSFHVFCWIIQQMMCSLVDMAPPIIKKGRLLEGVPYIYMYMCMHLFHWSIHSLVCLNYLFIWFIDFPHSSDSFIIPSFIGLIDHCFIPAVDWFPYSPHHPLSPLIELPCCSVVLSPVDWSFDSSGPFIPGLSIQNILWLWLVMCPQLWCQFEGWFPFGQRIWTVGCTVPGGASTRRDRSGLIWSHLVSSGLIWSHLVSSGLIWSHLVSSGLLLQGFRPRHGWHGGRVRPRRSELHQLANLPVRPSFTSWKISRFVTTLGLGSLAVSTRQGDGGGSAMHRDLTLMDASLAQRQAIHAIWDMVSFANEPDEWWNSDAFQCQLWQAWTGCVQNRLKITVTTAAMAGEKHAGRSRRAPQSHTRNSLCMRSSAWESCAWMHSVPNGAGCIQTCCLSDGVSCW